MQPSPPVAEIQHLHPNEGSLWCVGSGKLEIDELVGDFVFCVANYRTSSFA